MMELYEVLTNRTESKLWTLLEFKVTVSFSVSLFITLQTVWIY